MTSNEPTIRKRRPAAERRALIVEAARGVLAERGFAYTTMRDIAAASEVSLGTVTYHFEGIDEILREALMQERHTFYQTASEAGHSAGTGLEAVRAWVIHQLTPTPESRQHWSLWLDYWSIAAHDPEAAAFQSQMYADCSGDLRTFLEQGVTDGTLAINDVDATVVQLMGLMDGIASHAFLPADRVKEAEAVTATLQYVDHLAA